MSTEQERKARAYEQISIHTALSGARQRILALWGFRAEDIGQSWSRHGPYQKSHAFSQPTGKGSEK